MLDIIIWAIRFRAGVGRPVKETVQQTVDKHIYNFCSKSSYIFKKKISSKSILCEWSCK